MPRIFLGIGFLLPVYLLFVSQLYAEGNQTQFSEHKIKNFRSAKRFLKSIYQDRQIDFYCGCRYNYVKFDNYTRTLLASDCGVKPRKNTERAARIEWEHVVSAHAFGHTLPCWRTPICSRNGKAYKGRKCCIRIDPMFSVMEADLHNLRPVPGELNGDRSNFHYGILSDPLGEYGDCHFKVNFTLRKAEPDPRIRGDIARTYFYMEERYGVKISKKNRKLYEIWDREDPPDEWEKERNQRIFQVQGNLNPFISEYKERKGK